MKKGHKKIISASIILSAITSMCVVGNIPTIINLVRSSKSQNSYDSISNHSTTRLVESKALSKSFVINGKNSAIKYAYNDTVLDPNNGKPELSLVLGSFPDRTNMASKGTLYRRAPALRIYSRGAGTKIKLYLHGNQVIDNPTPLPFGLEYTPCGDPEAYNSYFRFGRYKDANGNQQDDINWRGIHTWNNYVFGRYDGEILQGVIQLQVPGWWSRGFDDTPARNYYWSKTKNNSWKNDNELIRSDHETLIPDGFKPWGGRDGTFQYVDDPNSDWSVGQLTLGVFDNKFWKGSNRKSDWSKISLSWTNKISSTNKFNGTMDEFVEGLSAANISEYLSISAFNTPSYCLDNAKVTVSSDNTGVNVNITTNRSFQPSLAVTYDKQNKINVLSDKKWIKDVPMTTTYKILANCFSTKTTTLKTKIIDANSQEFKNIFTDYLANALKDDFEKNQEKVKTSLINYINSNISTFFDYPSSATKVKDLTFTYQNNNLVVNSVTYVGKKGSNDSATITTSVVSAWQILNLKTSPSRAEVIDKIRIELINKLENDVSKEKPAITTKDALVNELVNILNNLKTPTATWTGLPQTYLPEGGNFNSSNININKDQVKLPSDFNSNNLEYTVPSFNVGSITIPQLDISIKVNSTIATTLKTKIIDANSQEFKNIFTDYLANGLKDDFEKNQDKVKTSLINYINKNINTFFNSPSNTTKVKDLTFTYQNNNLVVNSVTYVGKKGSNDSATITTSVVSAWQILNLKTSPSSNLVSEKIRIELMNKLQNDVSNPPAEITTKDALVNELVNILNTLKMPTTSWVGFPQTYLPEGGNFNSSNININKDQVKLPSDFNSNDLEYTVPSFNVGSITIPQLDISIKVNSTITTTLKTKIIDANSQEFKNIFTDYLANGFNLDFYSNESVIRSNLISYINKNVDMFFNDKSSNTQVNALSFSFSSENTIVFNNVSFVGYQNGNLSQSMNSLTTNWKITNLKNPPAILKIKEKVTNDIKEKLIVDVSKEKPAITTKDALVNELVNILNNLKTPTATWTGLPQTYLPEGGNFNSSNININKDQIKLPNFSNSVLEYTIPSFSLGKASIPQIDIKVNNPENSSTNATITEAKNSPNVLAIVLGTLGGLVLLILLIILIVFLMKRRNKYHNPYYDF